MCPVKVPANQPISSNPLLQIQLSNQPHVIQYATTIPLYPEIALITGFYHINRPFVLTTDASLMAVGAILQQGFGNGLQPAAFDSRKLMSTEMRYSAYERKLLGIFWAIGKWRHYFEGRPLIVQTDHSSLRHLPNQPSVNRRIWKWLSTLQGYDIEIRHIPGKINPADTLTRQHWAGDSKFISDVMSGV